MFWLALHCCSLCQRILERPENILWSFVVYAVQRSNNNNRCVVWSNACECGNPVKNHVLLNLVDDDDDGDGGVGGKAIQHFSGKFYDANVESSLLGRGA